MRKITTIIAAAVLALAFGGTALAAANPSGTGQPTQSCGSDTASQMPKGFNTSGFTSAALVYAGTPNSASANNSNSTKAVSQYDVACYQVSQ
jgi:hypothetical protein